MPNVGPYIYDVNISGFTRSSIYIYKISSLRVKELANSLCCTMNVKVVTENESWVHDFEAENMSQWGFVTKDYQH